MIFYIIKWCFIYLLLIILIDKIYDFFRDTLTLPYQEKSFIYDNQHNNNNHINHNSTNNLSTDNLNNNKDNNNNNNDNNDIIYDYKLDISNNMENELNNFIKLLEK